MHVEIKCRKCKEFLKEKVFQIKGGFLICEKCQNKLVKYEKEIVHDNHGHYCSRKSTLKYINSAEIKSGKPTNKAKQNQYFKLELGMSNHEYEKLKNINNCTNYEQLKEFLDGALNNWILEMLLSDKE